MKLVLLHTTIIVTTMLWPRASGLSSSTIPSPAALGPPTCQVLLRGANFAVLEKPPSVPCHHSQYVGDRDVFPMLQRARATLGARVNLVHRLDRGATRAGEALRVDGPGLPSTARLRPGR